MTSPLPNGAQTRVWRGKEGQPPQLMITIDTEEEFNWSAPFSRQARSVKNIAHQQAAQTLFEAAGVVPTYVVDQAVLEDDAAVTYFKQLADTGRAEIGVHLHPWLTPPYEEDLTPINSFHGNLPKPLEEAKINSITSLFADKMGKPPSIFKAGRYGLGPNSYDLLEKAGYQIDLSPVPMGTYGPIGGPDFRSFPCQPFWTADDKRLLSVPLTRRMVGAAAGIVPGELADSPLAKTVKMPAILARLKLAERLTLTPEGVSASEMIRLIDAALAAGDKLLSLAYHSSSLMVGGSPYSQSAADVTLILQRLKAVISYCQQQGIAFTSPTALLGQVKGG